MAMKPINQFPLSLQELQLIEKTEDWIDERLREGSPAKISIHMSLPFAPRSNALKEFKRRYEEAGWKNLVFGSTDVDDLNNPLQVSRFSTVLFPKHFHVRKSDRL